MGATYPGQRCLIVSKAMINATNTTYLTADLTKISKRTFASPGARSPIDFIITEAGID